jgi:hypothetical protein
MNPILQLKIIVVLSIMSFKLVAQEDSVWQVKPVLRFSGFVDIFYVYDFNQPQGSHRQPFLFNHNRHNEFNLNLGLVKFGLEQTKYRANLALQTGTYANDNYSAEPGLLKNIFEANIGVSLHKKNKLWLDAGILPSHLGFESAISMDNMTLTRSLLAENSPYFLTGAKLTFQPNRKWELAGLMVNGWQRIQRLKGNSLPSFGTQVKYSRSEKMVLNWSTFIGTNDPDSTRRMRYFSNLYGQFQPSKKYGFIAGFDLGVQEKVKNSSSYVIWLSPVIIGQYSIGKNWKIAIRGEYFQDETGVIISTGTTNGFKTTGVSLTIDYSPTSILVCRLEGRWLNSKDKWFKTNTGVSYNNFIIGTSIAIKFSEIISKK